MIAFLRRLFRGCWFSHNYTLEIRNKVGVQVCSDCRAVKKYPQLKKAYRDKTKMIRLATKPTAVVATFSGGSQSAIARRK